MFLRPVLVMLVICGAARGVRSQTVQLPTFQQFALGTTVVVPDRGGMSLGGSRSSASGASRFGAPGLRGNRATGSAVQAGGMSASVQIHDFQAMDQALLEQAATLRAVRGDQSSLRSLADIRREKASAAKPPVDDAHALIARADQASAAGRIGAAKIYLQMAARRATGALQKEAVAKYHKLQVRGDGSEARTKDGMIEAARTR